MSAAEQLEHFADHPALKASDERWDAETFQQRVIVDEEAGAEEWAECRRCLSTLARPARGAR